MSDFVLVILDHPRSVTVGSISFVSEILSFKILLEMHAVR